MFGINGLGFIKLPFYCFLSLCMSCVVCLWASLPELNKWMDGWMDYCCCCCLLDVVAAAADIIIVTRTIMHFL